MKIIRSFRKSISMKVDEQGILVVKAPIFITENKIKSFVNKHADWVETQQ
jgi:predicted metal-dependent hydrolase